MLTPNLLTPRRMSQLLDVAEDQILHAIEQPPQIQEIAQADGVHVFDREAVDSIRQRLTTDDSKGGIA